MPLRLIVALVCCLALPLVPAAADEPAVKQDALRGAIEKSLPLLMTGATGHRDNSNRGCFGCHNQGPPLFAVAAAKERGFKIDEAELGKHLTFIAKFLDGNRENYLQGKGTGGQADTAGYALWTLAAGGCQPCETTAAVAEYLLLRHKDEDHWLNTSKRPPTEATPFTTTYVALYGLASYGTPAQTERIAARRAQARDWLIKTPPKEHEERVFRLWGLDAAGASQSDIAAAAKELLAKQRDDGGWAQLDSGEPATALRSDAYATGTALVALHQVGGLAISDPAYQRGLAYLLKTQLEDGSWHVISRSKPFQPYFETGFPHGNDQFISAAASGWATWALVLACDKP
jgi:Squalene-hopene cyclase C-terminal domain